MGGKDDGLLEKASRPPRALLRGIRRWLRRTTKALVIGVTSTASLRGAGRIAGGSAVLACAIAGIRKTLVIVSISSAGTVLGTAVGRLIVADAGGSPILDDEQDDIMAILKAQGGIWAGLSEALDPNQLNRLMKSCPALYRPKLELMRNEAPYEFLLRVMSVMAAHGRAGPHPKAAPTGLQAHTVETDQPLVLEGESALTENDGEGQGNGQDEEGGGQGKDNNDETEKASSDLVDELREWLPFAEASYFNMMSEEMMGEWLEKRGYQLVVAFTKSTPSAPAHCVAVKDDEKRLLILVRGTMTVEDALTDMIAAPTKWEHDGHEHPVHQGIASSASHLYDRLAPVARAFHGNGYTVQIIGHSLGAGAGALFAWKLLKFDNLDNVRVIGYAMPPAAGPDLAKECGDHVISCVMRDDMVPRITPRAFAALEDQILGIDWSEMEACAKEWGTLGKWLAKAARKQSHNKPTSAQDCEGDEAEQQCKSDEGEGEGEENGDDKEGEGEEDGDACSMLFEPTVPGKIVWLRPTTEEASNVEAVISNGPEDVPGTKEEDKEIHPTTEENFEHLIIAGNNSTLNHLRVCGLAMNDHFFDSYRIGLNMPFRRAPPEESAEKQED